MSAQASFPASSPADGGASMLQDISEVDNITVAMVMGAAAFVGLFFYSLLQLFQHRAWFFSTFTLALGFEAGGFIALSWLAAHLTDHLAYVLSFAALTIGPAMLVLAVYSAYARYLNAAHSVERDSGSHRPSTSRSWVAPVFVIVECLAIVYFVRGIADLWALHSSTPITGRADALRRVAFEADAVAMFRTGNIIQLFGLGLTMLAGCTAATPKMDPQLENMRWAVQWASAFCFIRTFDKVLAFASLDTRALDVLEQGAAAWCTDLIPLILGVAIFIKHYPATQATSKLSREPTSEKAPRLSYDALMDC